MAGISVIIPTYNGTTRFLDRALDSVFKQTYSDWELIIVDDASTDDTATYIHDYVRSCGYRVHYIQRLVNGGPSAARNEGAKTAQGNFLAFLDQDDIWAPTFLEETLADLQDTSPDIGATHTDRWNIDANGERRKYVPTYQPQFRHTQITHTLCRGNKCLIQGMLVKRAAFEQVEGFDEQLRSGEDEEFLVRLHQRFRVSHIPKPLHSYRIRYGGSANNETAPLTVRIDNYVYRIRKQAHFCQEDPGLRKAFAAELAQLYYYQGKQAMSQRDKKTARHYFEAALRMRLALKNLFRYIQTYLPVL